MSVAEAPRASPHDALPALDQQLAGRLLEIESVDEAWTRGRAAVERAEIGRQREDALSGIVALRNRIVTARAVGSSLGPPAPRLLAAAASRRSGGPGAGVKPETALPDPTQSKSQAPSESVVMMV